MTPSHRQSLAQAATATDSTAVRFQQSVGPDGWWAFAVNPTNVASGFHLLPRLTPQTDAAHSSREVAAPSDIGVPRMLQRGRVFGGESRAFPNEGGTKSLEDRGPLRWSPGSK